MVILCDMSGLFSAASAVSLCTCKNIVCDRLQVSRRWYLLETEAGLP